MCADASISVSKRFSTNSSNHCGTSHKRSFDFCESLAGFHDQFPGASSSLRSETGLDDVLGVLDSFDGDVRNELNNPRTTSSTKFSRLHEIFFLVWSTVAVYC